MNPKIMAFRPGPKHDAYSPEVFAAIGDHEGFLSKWRTIVLDETNDKIIDGEYKTIRVYRGELTDDDVAPYPVDMWEVVVHDLPA